MATEAKLVGIKKSWGLVAFARMKGKMQVGVFKDKEGTPFKSCIFTDASGNRTFVSFSSNLGELTPREIAERKDSLQVCALESGTYKLCKVGENNWQDVDLGL